MNAREGKFEVFYDGQCPLCRREIEMIRRKDNLGRLILTDIAQPDFEPTDRTLEQLMREIHGRLPSGQLVTGVEVFRQIYQRIGFHGLVGPTRWPGVRNLLNLVYKVFASIRYRHAAKRMKAVNCGPDRNNCKLPELQANPTDADSAAANRAHLRKVQS